jgi:diacylglycerol O-acyltransferase / wax synthase
MQSLTGLDATFLYLETPEMPMHVGSFALCGLPAGFKGSFHKAVIAHITKRMHLAPVFSRKLVFMPMDLGHPLWVEADKVDMGFHIRRADAAKKGAAPMTLAEAHKLCAQLHSELIDRNFPLWEFYVFDRIKLPDGSMVAGFFSKIHHAALDGKGGVLLANALLDITPIPREVAPPDTSRRGPREGDLKISKMIGTVFSSSLGQLLKAAKLLPSAAGSLGASLAKQSSAGAATSESTSKMPLKLAPPTGFNGGVSQGRVFVTATAPLAECKSIGKAIGGSFNDVVLWICSTALRSYLTQHHSLPKKSLVAAMPVSLRESGQADATNLGNQVNMSLVELGTHLVNPLKRMNAIMASTAKVKSSVQSLKGLLPTDYPSLLAPWLVGGAAKMALNAAGKSNLFTRLPVLANVVISNVPGAPMPLFLAGAQFLTFHPVSIIIHGLALNITVQTYAGRVDFGIVADKKALPHANDFAKAIEAAFVEAVNLMGSAHEATDAVANVTEKVAKSASIKPAIAKPAVKRAGGSSKSDALKSPKATTHAKTVVKKRIKRAVSL